METQKSRGLVSLKGQHHEKSLITGGSDIETETTSVLRYDPLHMYTSSALTNTAQSQTLFVGAESDSAQC